MKILSKLYHFLGGIYFTIVLIGSVALFVIAGTIVESQTHSHLYAAKWTYGNPVFALLLWGFFINILFSATRRWPFQVKHVPFLTTHFGLLMVLGGALIKSYVGQQGTMNLIEGSASDRIYEINTHAIFAEKRGESSPRLYTLPSHLTHPLEIADDHDGLQLSLLAYTPHSTQKFATWVKDNFLTVDGWEPIPIKDTSDPVTFDQLQPQITVNPGEGSESWEIYALRSRDAEACVDKLSKNIKMPSLSFIEDKEGSVHIHAFDRHGPLWNQIFTCQNFQSLYAYDDGFGGYAVQVDIPKVAVPNMEIIIAQLSQELNEAVVGNALLAPPLQIFQKSCQSLNIDFVKTFVNFLVQWDEAGGWLFPSSVKLSSDLTPVFQNLDMSQDDIAPACQWTVRLFDQIGPDLQRGDDIMKVLRKRKWPLMASLEEMIAQHNFNAEDRTHQILSLLTQQIFSTASMLPSIEFDLLIDPAKENVRLYSAYLRAYDIHLRSIISPSFATASRVADTSAPNSTFTLETSVVPIGTPLPPEKKLEDNVPLITVQAKRGPIKQTITLAYDRSAAGLKWPILNGQYLLRFQPKYSHIPYRVRLRQARQINYAHSGQPYSYESDLIITDQRNGKSIEKTISMNHVHETHDGYRFYLSNMALANESGVKRVQLVVNHDPAKYWLTYPGAIIMCCGIVLLFSLRPYKK